MAVELRAIVSRLDHLSRKMFTAAQWHKAGSAVGLSARADVCEHAGRELTTFTTLLAHEADKLDGGSRLFVEHHEVPEESTEALLTIAGDVQRPIGERRAAVRDLASRWDGPPRGRLHRPSAQQRVKVYDLAIDLGMNIELPV